MSDSVTSKIDVRAGPQAILDVLTDFESYPEWARSVKVARVRTKGPDGRPEQVEFEVSPGPLPKMRYVLRYTYRDDGIAWEYVEGDLKDIKGAYVLRPGEEGTSVSYELTIDFDVQRLQLPGFIKARGAREISRIALQELKRRVEG